MLKERIKEVKLKQMGNKAVSSCSNNSNQTTVFVVNCVWVRLQDDTQDQISQIKM